MRIRIKDWIEVEKLSKVSLFPTYIYVASATRDLKKYLGRNIEGMAIAGMDDFFYWIVKKNSLKNMGLYFLKRLLKEQKLIDKFEADYYKFGNSLLDFSRQVSRIKINKISTSKLLKYLDGYIKLFSKVCLLSASIASLEQEEPLLFNILTRYLKKKTKNWSLYFNHLITHSELSIIEQEVLGLYKIANNYFQNKKISNLLRKHKERYCFMGYDFEGPAWNLAYYNDRLKRLLKQRTRRQIRERIRRLENKSDITKRTQSQIIKRLGISSRYQKYFKITQRLIYLRGYSKYKISIQSRYLIDKLVNELSKRLKLTNNELRLLKVDEMKEYYHGKITRSLIEQRKSAVIYFGYKRKLEVESGQKAREVISQIFLQSEPKKEKIIKGMVVCPGKVVGRARIVTTEKDIRNFNKGEILVANVTNPSFMPAIIKAKAVIANQGGITSHSAIVCRELDKISIINTKIATKVLKDGDLLEVNGNKGIIKRL